MAKQKSEAQYEPPASQVDLAARLESGNRSDRILSTSDEAFRRQAEDEEAAGEDSGRVMQVEGNDVSGYVGVDPIYANYANETEKPGKAEGDDNPEAELEEANFGQLPTHSWEVSDETKAKLEAAAKGEDVSDDDDSDDPELPDLPTPNSADNPS